jgi:multiple sugar transport system ATP-binding protein
VSLVVRGLGHRYRGADAPALQGVDLEVAAGEVLAVVGPSGSGKSTLLRLLTGLLPATQGTIEIGGTDVTRVAPERRPVALVFQGYALFPHLTVRDNIGFGLRVRKVASSVRAARVDEVAATLRLTEMLDRLPAQLSGGERQRVALARSLVRDPIVFCLDEPLSSLDPLLRTAARRDLDTLLRAEGRCAVYVTHDQDEAMTVGDRVAVIADGQLQQVGTTREVYDTPATPFVASFIGSPPMSLLRAAGGAAGPVRAPHPVADGALLGVRAERVVLGPGDDGEVVLVDDHGHELLVSVAMGDETLVARVPSTSTLRRGQRVSVTVDPADVRVFEP